MHKALIKPLFLLAGLFALTSCTSVDYDFADVSRFRVEKTRFYDSKPVDFGRNAPHGLPVHGIDISKYQGDIDWKTLPGNGVSFAWIKATEGGDRVDSAFARNWKQAREAGIPRGAYHFYYWCTSGADQARWMIANVPRERGALPPVLDLEWNFQSPTCPRKVPRAQALNEIGDFLRITEKHYGVRPVLYVTIDFHEDVLEGALPGYDYWLRSTRSHPSERYENRQHRFWQYTATGRIEGIDGDVDINAFNGSKKEWAKWLKAVMS